ncbi:uncharacterized protein VP01_1582g4 [Puccinia sorghi]|uniref:Uncharacterized protein n=1 Tax=Puccinia sorghi TaxID=27349 RepID=A0A0L6VHT1_9BASI|nr:uncharacterized protein VP01_1582g4 [Puccinia sorghi]
MKGKLSVHQLHGFYFHTICNYFKTIMRGKALCGTKRLWRHLDRCFSFLKKEKQLFVKLLEGSSTSTWLALKNKIDQLQIFGTVTVQSAQ